MNSPYRGPFNSFVNSFSNMFPFGDNSAGSVTPDPAIFAAAGTGSAVFNEPFMSYSAPNTAASLHTKDHPTTTRDHAPSNPPLLSTDSWESFLWADLPWWANQAMGALICCGPILEHSMAFPESTGLSPSTVGGGCCSDAASSVMERSTASVVTTASTGGTTSGGSPASSGYLIRWLSCLLTARSSSLDASPWLWHCPGLAPSFQSDLSVSGGSRASLLQTGFTLVSSGRRLSSVSPRLVRLLAAAAVHNVRDSIDRTTERERYFVITNGCFGASRIVFYIHFYVWLCFVCVARVRHFFDHTIGCQLGRSLIGMFPTDRIHSITTLPYCITLKRAMPEEGAIIFVFFYRTRFHRI